VYVDKRVLLKHTGTYVFDAGAQDKLYLDLHAIAQQNAAAAAPPAVHDVPAEVLAAEPEAEIVASSNKTDSAV
jgi:hypothetical protein